MSTSSSSPAPPPLARSLPCVPLSLLPPHVEGWPTSSVTASSFWPTRSFSCCVSHPRVEVEAEEDAEEEHEEEVCTPSPTPRPTPTLPRGRSPPPPHEEGGAAHEEEEGTNEEESRTEEE